MPGGAEWGPTAIRVRVLLPYPICTSGLSTLFRSSFLAIPSYMIRVRIKLRCHHVSRLGLELGSGEGLALVTWVESRSAESMLGSGVLPCELCLAASS